MCKYKKKHIEIDNNTYEFNFDIRAVIQYGDNYIVLLSVSFDKSEINNIYCLNSQSEILWRSEDLRLACPKLKNILPYEQMGLRDDFIFASDFYGRNYKINAIDGKIEGFDIVK